MALYNLKLHTSKWEAITSGNLPYDIRDAAHGLQNGDEIRYLEFDGRRYTGRTSGIYFVAHKQDLPSGDLIVFAIQQSTNTPGTLT